MFREFSRVLDALAETGIALRRLEQRLATLEAALHMLRASMDTQRESLAPASTEPPPTLPPDTEWAPPPPWS